MRTHQYFLAGLDAELGAPFRRPAPRQPPRALSFRAPAGRAPTFRPAVPRPPPPASAFRPSVVPPPPPPASAFRPSTSTTSGSTSTSTSTTARPGLPQFRPQFRPPGRPTATAQSYAAQQSYAQQAQPGYEQAQQQYAQQAPQQAQSDYAQQQPQVQGGGYQPSTPMGALEYYNEARKLRGMPALPPDAGNTDKDIANYLMQRMVGDEDRRATFEETMYAVLILSAQAASRVGDANAAQAMTQAADQWKQAVLQQRAQAKQQYAAQTRIFQSPNGPAPVQSQEQGENKGEGEGEGEGENKESSEGEVSGWGDLGESLSPNTRTILAVAGAFGLAWGGLCLWKNRKKKGA